MSWLFLVVIVVVAVWAISAYNALIKLKGQTLNAWKQIDVQLKRRHDLIPNLVEAVRGAMEFERETLEAVIAARNQALGAAKQAASRPDDPGAIQGLTGAEGILSGALGKLFALVESYPDLKANQNMMQLSEELSSTENRIAFARQAFNDAVMQYNTDRESFPDNIIANNFGFKAAQLLELEDVRKKEVPQVSFA